MTTAEAVDWVEERQKGLLTEAWHHAYLYALTKLKGKFPKSPEDLFKAPATEEQVAAVLVAGAQARKSSQEADAILKRKGREKVIRREV